MHLSIYSSKFEENNWSLSLLKVYVVPGLVGDYSSETLADNAMPVRTIW